MFIEDYGRRFVLLDNMDYEASPEPPPIFNIAFEHAASTLFTKELGIKEYLIYELRAVIQANWSVVCWIKYVPDGLLAIFSKVGANYGFSPGDGPDLIMVQFTYGTNLQKVLESASNLAHIKSIADYLSAN